MERNVFTMEKNLTRISTRSMSRQAWLAERRKTIGGSDAAGIVGLSRYATPYTVWADKTGRLPEQEDNEAMRQGRDLEEYVAKRWEESTGKRVRRSNALLYNPSYLFAHADIDRTVVFLWVETGAEAHPGQRGAWRACLCLRHLPHQGRRLWLRGVQH